MKQTQKYFERTRLQLCGKFARNHNRISHNGNNILKWCHRCLFAFHRSLTIENYFQLLHLVEIKFSFQSAKRFLLEQFCANEWYERANARPLSIPSFISCKWMSMNYFVICFGSIFIQRACWVSNRLILCCVFRFWFSFSVCVCVCLVLISACLSIELKRIYKRQRCAKWMNEWMNELLN